MCRFYKKPNSEERILQFILFQRADNKQWALPGGMVDAGQILSKRIKDLFQDYIKKNDNYIKKKLKELTEEHDVDNILYRGVVDDPRNTDNAWMETIVVLIFLDPSIGDYMDKLIDGFEWKDYDYNLELFASHKKFVDAAVHKLIERGLLDSNERPIIQKGS